MQKGSLHLHYLLCFNSPPQPYCGLGNNEAIYFQLGFNSIPLCQIGHAKGGHHCPHQISLTFVTYQFKGHEQTNKLPKVEM